jgi:hypothetical protein
MQVATETLELRGEQHGVCLVDLLRRVTSASRCAADRDVSILDLVQAAVRLVIHSL